MHSSGAYQLLSPLGSWFLWMCRRRCECGFAEGGEGNGNIPPWAGCHGRYIKPTTSSCIPVFVCHRLTPESGHSGTDWLIDASRTWTLYSFRIIMMISSLWLFRVKKQIDISELDVMLVTTAVWPQLNPAVLGTMILQGQEKDPSQQCREWTPWYWTWGVLQSRWCFLQGRVKFCFDTIVYNGCLWVF